MDRVVAPGPGTLARPGRLLADGWSGIIRHPGLPVALLLAPALLVVVPLFGGGLLLALLQSVGQAPLFGRGTFGLAAYEHAWSDPGFRDGLLLSLWIALVSTGLSATLAVACALLLRAVGPGRRFLAFVFQLGLPIPHVVAATAMLLLLAQGGLVSRGSYALGLTRSPADFPALVADEWAVGILLTYVWKELPFIGVVALAALSRRVGELEDAARAHGANGWQCLWSITLPLIAPPLLTACGIVLAFTFGAYEVPYLLGRSYPEPLPVLAYRLYTDADLAQRPVAMAVGLTTAAVAALMVGSGAWIARRWLPHAR